MTVQFSTMTLDGDHPGHSFRGNQHVSASGESRSAVTSSKKAKHTEKHGDTKAQKKAHKVAHHAHMAAAEEATTKAARKYHKTMAKFHGGRAGMTLDSVTFDDASDFQDSIVGKIMKDGQQMGRAVIGGDGKAMVFVGESDDQRVKYVHPESGQSRDAIWGDDGAKLVDWLMAPAAAPVDTPSEVPASEADELTVDGKESKVKTAKGTEVVTGFSVVEASRLITSHDPATGDVNPDFPQELQPRDRGRQTSRAWVLKTAANLDPEQLGKTRRADTGAPIVGKDRVVESGNGRTMAIIEAYRTGKADEYREWLESEAEYFGLDPQKVKAMKRPVLVRVRTSKVNRAEFAVEANQDDKLAMTATEKAKADANRLTDDMIALMTDNGDLNSAGNHRFLSAFLASLGDAEAAQYSTSDGKPTSSLIARVQAAIFAKAYNDDRLLELTADSAKPEIANIISALNFAAPEFIQAIALDPKATADAAEKLTDSIEASLNEQAVAAIIAATNVIKQAKETGMQVDEFVKQQGLFGDIDPSVAAMAVFISKNNRSAKRMGSAFKAMATFVKGEIQRRQTTDMFGESVNVGFPEIIAAANRELEREYGEGVFAIETIDMFARKNDPAPTPESTATPDPAIELPETVKASIGRLLAPVKELAEALDRARGTDAKFGSEGRYGAESWREMNGDKRIADEAQKIASMLASIPSEANRAAASAYIEANRAKPTLTDKELNYFAPAAADPKTEDRAFFMSVIDGSNPDILEPELADKLAQAYERHAGDAEITSLFMQAGNAYTQAMLAATEGV